MMMMVMVIMKNIGVDNFSVIIIIIGENIIIWWGYMLCTVIWWFFGVRHGVGDTATVVGGGCGGYGDNSGGIGGAGRRGGGATGWHFTRGICMTSVYKETKESQKKNIFCEKIIWEREKRIFQYANRCFVCEYIFTGWWGWGGEWGLED